MSRASSVNAKPGVAEGLSMFEGDFTYSVNALNAQMKFLLGRLLTVVDASIANPDQCRAIKDLITKEVWERRDWILESVSGRGNREKVD